MKTRIWVGHPLIKNSQPFSGELLDLTSQKIRDISTPEVEIKLDGIPKGTYLLKIHTEKKEVIKRIIKL